MSVMERPLYNSRILCHDDITVTSVMEQMPLPNYRTLSWWWSHWICSREKITT